MLLQICFDLVHRRSTGPHHYCAVFLLEFDMPPTDFAKISRNRLAGERFFVDDKQVEQFPVWQLEAGQ